MSNLLKRVLVGVVGIPLIIFICYTGGVVFLIFSLIVSSIALWELYSLLEKKGFYPLKVLGILISVSILILYYLTKEDFILFEYILLILLISIEIFRREKKNPYNPLIVLFGLIYISIPFAMLSDLIELSKLNLVIYIFILIWICDIAAYFGGRFFGKHLLSSISPKKTWEGSITGFVCTILMSVIIHFIYPNKLYLNDALIIGTIIGIFSQVGDLFESLIKRYCDVKDSSNIIPGHGGILDRFDSLIFVTPIVYIYFKYVK